MSASSAVIGSCASTTARDGSWRAAAHRGSAAGAVAAEQQGSRSLVFVPRGLPLANADRDLRTRPDKDGNILAFLIGGPRPAPSRSSAARTSNQRPTMLPSGDLLVLDAVQLDVGAVHPDPAHRACGAASPLRWSTAPCCSRGPQLCDRQHEGISAHRTPTARWC